MRITPSKIIALILSCLVLTPIFAICISNIKNETPNSRYTVHNNGTVTDNTTELMWKVCAQGQDWSNASCNGVLGQFDWVQALLSAQMEHFTTYSDWRLPNRKELLSIVAYHCFGPSINERIFPNTPSKNFWSSSPHGTANTAWYIDFYIGYPGNSRRVIDNPNTSNTYAVRLVRGNKAQQSDFRISSTSPLIVGTMSTATAIGGQSGGTITFTSSHPAVANVDTNTGVITAKTLGTTTIIATRNGGQNYEDISISYTLTVANTFSQGIAISTDAENALSVFAIDLDNDGDNDVLSASSRDNKIAWYENDGNGIFISRTIISTQAQLAASVFATDLDNDGDNDVLSASFADNKIAWYKNTGKGTFSTQKIITTNAIGAFSVFAIDLDGDGYKDVLSASRLDGKIAWYKNNGNGTFSRQPTINNDGAFSVFAIDLDGDGYKDVLSANGVNKTLWFKNTGRGTFSRAKTIRTQSGGGGSVFAIDLDGDGDNDVLSTSQIADKIIAWYKNDGRGVFISGTTISAQISGTISVFATDLDNDGDNDVLSASEKDGKIAWYENTSSGTFSTQKIITRNVARARSVFAIDLDGDGDNDVLSASFANHEIAWYRNNTTQIKTAPNIKHIDNLTSRYYGLNTAISPFKLSNSGGNVQRCLAQNLPSGLSVKVSEKTCVITGLPTNIANNDNIIITAQNIKGSNVINLDITIVALVNDTSLTFGGGTLTLRTNVFTNPTYIFDGTPTHGFSIIGDQLAVNSNVVAAVYPLNLIISGGGTRLYTQISVIVNKVQQSDFRISGTPLLIIRATSTATASGGQSGGSITFASSHSAVANVGTNTGIITAKTLGTTTIIATRNGKQNYEDISTSYTLTVVNTFSQGIVISTNAVGAFSVFAIDLDNDGDNDVLSASRQGNKIAWYENDGRGVFISSTTISTQTSGSVSVFAADLDNDGDNDVLSASRLDDKIAWYRNEGGGNFGGQQIISTGTINPVSVFAIDLDGDGDRDVLSASFNGNKTAWYENNGRGIFSTSITITNNNTGAIFAIDLDNDGDNDVLTAEHTNNRIAWYRNEGNGNFTNQTVSERESSNLTSVFAIDLDGDGDNDVLSASILDDKIAWYENLDGSDTFGQQQIITDYTHGNNRADAAYSVFAIDLDGDGDNDVLSASSGDNKIAWYKNTDGSGTFSTQKIITINASSAVSVFAIDLDGDGDNDVLSASQQGNKIAWYRNNSPNPITPPSIALPAGALNMAGALTTNLPLPIIPINTGGYIDRWLITPILTGTPSFNTRSGALYGTINLSGNAVRYTITATNAGGTDTITLHISPR